MKRPGRQRPFSSFALVSLCSAPVHRLRHAGLAEAGIENSGFAGVTDIRETRWYVDCNGTFVEPSFDSFEDAAATASFDARKGFYLWLNNAPGRNSGPIAGATFILFAKEKKDANSRVIKFFD